MRLLVGMGVLFLLRFGWWFIASSPVGFAPLFWLLTLSLGFALLHIGYEWYHYVNVREPVASHATSRLTVDVLTTACPGEPLAMIEQTLRAMKAIRYPHTDYLCDEGNNPYLQALCSELNIVYVTRQLKVNAKAGNINNALQGATGDLCVVLDPDHVPTPDFLEHVLPYFADPTVGFVQVVQSYGNQSEGLVALGAAQQTYYFYGPLMMGMNAYGTVQAIGANCTFRRAALDSIGGHAAGLTEDMHTAMRMHAKGWKSVYVPRVLSKGLVPSSLAAYYSQQLKWSRGAFDLLLRVYPRLFAHFSWRQRLHYLLLPLYFLSGVITLIDLAIPIASLVLYQFPWHIPIREFMVYALPLVGLIFLIRHYAQQWLREPHETGLHITGGFLRVGTWWVYAIGFCYALLRIKVPYIPTPKEGKIENEWKLSLPNILVAFISIGAAVYGVSISSTNATKMMAGFAVTNAIILLIVVLMGQHALLRFLNAKAAALFGRNLHQRVSHFSASLTSVLETAVRRYSLVIATVLVVSAAFSDVVVSRRHSMLKQRQAEKWIHTGGDDVHFGLMLPNQDTIQTLTSQEVDQSMLPATSPSRIVAINLSTINSSGLPVILIQSLLHRHTVPLLTWHVNAGDTLPSTLIAHQLKQIEGMVMLRPMLSAHSASAYRREWQLLVGRIQNAGGTNAAWIWSPPQPDSLIQYFPGARYTNWIAADYRHQNVREICGATSPYQKMRLQISSRIELHEKPVVLFAAPDLHQQSAAQSKIIRSACAEIKAVVYQSSILSQTRRKRRRLLANVHDTGSKKTTHLKNLELTQSPVF
ncbi:glycosyltransferase family 2 protein [Hymenobacter profundi]|uniref:Glycosyltransferase n=1 Tax=Hymenobacter profundi TaxID=1982110 RepID=A0ABS6X563_9BACT|nr:cellulose synthase catalytic subunit [Hymenobacter profundi]MBW3130972.1 glycosyltransferase [Hymenobacter profundi]